MTERLYLQDTETGETLLIAKGFGGMGWGVRVDADNLEEWLEGRDIGAFTAGSPTKLRLITEQQLCEEGVARMEVARAFPPGALE